MSTHQSIFKAERNETRLGLEVMRETIEDRLKSLLVKLKSSFLIVFNMEYADLALTVWRKKGVFIPPSTAIDIKTIKKV